MNGTDSREAMITQPLLDGDWQRLKDALAWLKDVRDLVQNCGGITPMI